MNRLSFLKKLGIGAVAIAIAPKAVAEMSKKEEIIYPRLKDGVTIDTELLPIKRYDAEEIMKIWRQTGDLVYAHNSPTFWDRCIDKQGQEWIITEMWPQKIVLLPVQVRTNKYGQKPIKMTVRRDYFNKMFIIIIPHEQRI
jgi:hypothetical protein